jgi:hypothetical protein
MTPTAVPYALAARAAWKRARAAVDTSDAAVASGALDDLLACPATFDEPYVLKALPAFVSWWWDRVGYVDDRPARLWSAFAEHALAHQDPWLASVAQAQRAWHLACVGDLERLDALVDQTLRLDPDTFGDGPSRHPEAPDAPSSVWWAQLCVLRPALWSAAWKSRQERAQELLDALVEVLDAIERPIDHDVWALDAAMRAAIAAGSDDWVRGHRDAWVHKLRGLHHPRAPFHEALAIGLTARENHERRAAFDRAAALTEVVGPDWRADVWWHRERMEHGEACTPSAELRTHVDRYGLWGVTP